jgi:hypothetical protein
MRHVTRSWIADAIGIASRLHRRSRAAVLLRPVPLQNRACVDKQRCTTGVFVQPLAYAVHSLLICEERGKRPPSPLSVGLTHPTTFPTQKSVTQPEQLVSQNNHGCPLTRSRAVSHAQVTRGARSRRWSPKRSGRTVLGWSPILDAASSHQREASCWFYDRFVHARCQEGRDACIGSPVMVLL